jgi:hypothetical protein
MSTASKGTTPLAPQKATKSSQITSKLSKHSKVSSRQKNYTNAMNDEMNPTEKQQRLQALKEERKELVRFNKQLGPKQFFQADLIFDEQDGKYRDKVAQCFQMRMEHLNKQKRHDDKKW